MRMFSTGCSDIGLCNSRSPKRLRQENHKIKPSLGNYLETVCHNKNIKRKKLSIVTQNRFVFQSSFHRFLFG